MDAVSSFVFSSLSFGGDSAFFNKKPFPLRFVRPTFDAFAQFHRHRWTISQSWKVTASPVCCHLRLPVNVKVALQH